MAPATILTMPLDDLPDWLPAWCVDQLGDEPVSVLFELRQISAVFGPRLAGGRDVVVKAREDDGRAASCVARAGLGTAEQGQGVVLVAHSNAGLLLSVITAALPDQVLGCVFVDAAIPPAAGAAPVAPPELLALLGDKASGGRLPRWTDWWDEEEVGRCFRIRRPARQ